MGMLRRFLEKDDGVSAVEFALTLPVMAAVLFGAVQMSNSLDANRRVSRAAASVADLVAQGEVLTDAGLQDVFTAADAILQPLDPASLTVVITSLRNENDQARVTWSEAHRKQPRLVNDIVELPPGILPSGSTVIMAEVTYTYSDPIGAVAIGGLSGIFNFEDTYYGRPRRSVAVARVPN